MSAVRRQEEAVAIGRVFSIGASNAGQTAAALERKGIRVVPISTPGCSVTREGVEIICRRLKGELRKDDIVLVQWFENSIYFVLNPETGSMELPTRNEQDGIFHVTGKVAVSKDMQLETLLDKLEPFLAENPDNLKVLLCPLVRYLEDCCRDHPRDEKQKQEDGVRQLKELYQLRRVLKSWIIRKKFRNTIMIDPLGCLGAAASLDKAKSVMADCFHLNARAREVVAGRIKEQVVSWLRGRKRGSDTSVGGDSKRLKLDPVSTGGKSESGMAGTSRKGAGMDRGRSGGKSGGKSSGKSGGKSVGKSGGKPGGNGRK
jgi:hypothetical protein